MKFNGHIVLNADGTAQIKNAFIEQLPFGSVPAASGTNLGRMIYVTTTGGGYTANTFYYSDGAAWQSVATGAGAGGVQGEVDAIEVSLGAAVNSDGTFNAAAFSGPNIAGASSVTDAINQLDAAIETIDSLDEILPGTNGQVIYNNAGTWATAAPGATSGVQGYDAGLTSIAGLTTTANQTIYTTGADTYAVTTLTAFGRSLIDDADSSAGRTTLGVVIGTDVQAYDPDLSSLAALTPTDDNIIVSTASGYELQTPAQVRTTLSLVPGTDVQAYDADLAQLAGFAPADGDFIVGTGGASGSRYALESGATARTSLGLGDIATHDSAEFIRTDGTSSVTADISLNSHKLVAVSPGTAGTDAVNKNQLDAAVAGLSWKQAVRAATTADVDLSTDLADGQTVDGVTLATGDRVLVKSQAAPAENGIYVVPAAGAASRATDLDVAAEFSGATVFVTEGTANADSGWTQTAEVVTVGTTAVSFVQFTGSGTYAAGTGLSLSGNTFNVNLGAGIAELPSDEVGLDLYNATTGAIILTTDGSARSTASGSQLHLKTNTTQFDQDATNGLFIKSAGVTETELAGSVAGAGLSGGAGSALAVNVDGSSIEINADTLRVKAAGVTNAMLSTGGAITLKSNSGAQTEGMVLGEDLNFEATSGTGLTVAVSAGNTVTVAGVNASTSVKGVASFTAADFSVTSGVVSAVAKSIDAATDVALTSPTAGDTLIHDGTNFVNQKVYFLYTGSSATSHVVTHNLGQKYANVTVVETATDEVVIPQSITFDSTSQLTVTFNAAMACKVVVMAVA